MPSSTNGTASANVTGYNAESGDTVTATDSGKTGTTNSFAILPAGLDHFDMAAVSPTRRSSDLFAVTATAKDAFGNTKTGYSGVASLSGTLGDSASGCQSDHTTMTRAHVYS